MAVMKTFIVFITSLRVGISNIILLNPISSLSGSSVATVEENSLNKILYNKEKNPNPNPNLKLVALV
jgi:hypothetical protein